MKTNLLSCVLALVALFSFVSCNEDGAVTPGSAKDPAGTVIANIRNSSNQYVTLGEINGDYAQLYLDSANNFSGSGGYTGIVMVGKGSSIGSIKTSSVPTTGWAAKTAALEGALYILRFERKNMTYYFGLQVIDTLTSSSDNGIIGYTVKYCQFSLEEGWL